MKKLNFDNELSNDDEQLIEILKSRSGPKPSEKFVENTMEKFLFHKTNRKEVYKPLKTPVYLMFAIVVILLVPMLIAVRPQVSRNMGFELQSFIENLFFQIDSWYMFTIIVVLPALLSVFWTTMGVFKFRNTSI
ncbi:hypothetical protein ABN763_06895 [Spongiivirga sp. MCCC 1A20706]|uniref:hypothetical protein n=1 Tax=Spongiivirga sp. MCCC 1A20706 TaxID=3160963 RepID=UPI0039778171